MSKDITPTDTRYIPLTQQPYCCVPTCIQMIMYRHGIPLMPAELIGYHLGLVVPKEERELFWKSRSGEKPPSTWGTQIERSEFSPNAAFKKLGIPLRMSLKLIDQFVDEGQLKTYLQELEKRGADVIVCFSYGILFETDSRNGHCVMFDRIKGNAVRLVDPETKVPKWRNVTVDKLFEAMRSHGPEKGGGFWEFSPTI